MVTRRAQGMTKTRSKGRSGWATRLFAGAGTAFLLLILGIAFSGGGLSRGTLPEPINTVAVVVTWIALLALVVLLPLAVLTGLFTLVGSWTAPAPAASAEDDQLLGPRRRETRGLLALVALTIAAAYLWSETGANRSLEVMPFALVVLGSSLVFAWLVIRAK